MWVLVATTLLFGISSMPKFVTARFCEGGHICSLPRECCTQGCCPPYQSGPRQLPPPSEHVLNLFFISHWFFWCVVVAIILAILCAYSLWKKRRTLCGWGFSEHHAQSEGDSAGSCYAPPQYSRCSSFHHPPPPYTEVTSKPDLYPLVFTCNSDNGKNGSSYLMVQYFRNYIVRPAGSLSAASTVDSLSSSFICNANEANTLVPPPYSRAASPDIGFTSHFQHQQQQQQQQQYIMPRSASQLVCANNINGQQLDMGTNLGAQQVYQQPPRTSHYTASVTHSSGSGGGAVGGTTTTYNAMHMPPSESGNFAHIDSGAECSRSTGSAGSNNSTARDQRTAGGGFVQSQSDQHFRYMANSNSSISDIFVNNSCMGGIVGVGSSGADNSSIRLENASISDPITTNSIGVVVAHPQAGGTPVIYSNGCIKPNPLHRASTNPTQFVTADDPQHHSHRDHAVYNSCNSIGGISITVPVGGDGANSEFQDLHMLRQSLETCCQLLQQQQHQQQQQQMPTTTSFIGGADSPLRLNELAKKYADAEGLRSYVTSGTCSGVSSLANIGTPSSPPQATSPTGEVKEILDQIRQLQEGVSYEDIMLASSQTRPMLHHTMSSPSPSPSASHQFHSKRHSADTQLQLQHYATMPEQKNSITSLATMAISPTTYVAADGGSGVGGVIVRSPSAASTHSGVTTSLTLSSSSPRTVICSKPTMGGFVTAVAAAATSKRPSTLQQSKKKFFSTKPANSNSSSKAMYIPMMPSNHPSPPNRCILKSPVSSVVGGASFFVNRGRAVRKGWISRSAPTTPGTGLPPNHLDDDSPLLNEHDEDQEGEQNEEIV